MYCEPIMLEGECHATAVHRKRRTLGSVSYKNPYRPPSRMPEPNDRIRIRPSRPYTPGRPTALTPPSPPPSGLFTRPHTHTHSKREMSTERGGIGTVFRAPMKQKENASQGRAQKEEDLIVLRVTHLYTILTNKKTTARTHLRVGVRGCLALYSIFCLFSGFGWIDLPWKNLQFLNHTSSFCLTLFFSLLSWVDPAKRRRNKQKRARGSAQQRAIFTAWAQ